MASAAKPATSENVDAWSVIVDGESRFAGAVVTKAKYSRVVCPIVTVMLGVIDSCRIFFSFLERSSEITDHHVRANPWLTECPVKAASPAVRGRSEAESLDGAEVSLRIGVVMAGCVGAIVRGMR
jgi:hypothetical protein